MAVNKNVDELVQIHLCVSTLSFPPLQHNTMGKNPNNANHNNHNQQAQSMRQALQHTIATNSLAMMFALILCAIVGMALVFLVALLSNRHDPNSTTSRPVMRIVRYADMRMRDLRAAPKTPENMARFNELYNMLTTTIGAQQVANMTGVDFTRLDNMTS